MMRVPMNMVPLSPITMVRPPAWPDDQTSTLKPAGTLILSSGSLSAAAAIGGVGCGARLWAWPLAPTLVLSIGLNPGGDCPGTGEAVGGAAGAGCCAQPALAAINTAMLAAAGRASRYVENFMYSPPWCGSA